jgi:hypothetical protein
MIYFSGKLLLMVRVQFSALPTGFLKLCIQRAYSYAKSGEAEPVLLMTYWHRSPFLMAGR